MVYNYMYPSYGQLCVDPQLKVFDLRFLRPVSPYEGTMLQPFLVRCVPAMEATLLVLSQMGKFQLLDLHGLVTPSNMVVHPPGDVFRGGAGLLHERGSFLPVSGIQGLQWCGPSVGREGGGHL